VDLLLFKNEEQVIKDGIERLNRTSLNIQGSSGKLARLLLNIVNSIIGGTNGAYDALRVNHLKAFLSTSYGDSLDAIGQLVNCMRNMLEDDEAYKYRISKSTQSLAAANEISIRLAALSITGVESVVIKEHTYGTGSFVVYVITNNSVNSTSIMTSVKEAIDKVKAYGIKYELLTPIVNEVKLNMVVNFISGVSDNDKRIIYIDTKNAIVNFINNLHMEQSLILNDIITMVNTSNSKIRSSYITSLKINGKSVFLTDQTCRWNQRFMASSNENTITITGG